QSPAKQRMIVRDDQAYRFVRPLHLLLNLCLLCLLGPHVASADSIARLGIVFTACHRLASIGVRENTQPGLLPAADELQHDFAPMRPGAMLGDVDTLPDPRARAPPRSRGRGATLR